MHRASQLEEVQDHSISIIARRDLPVAIEDARQAGGYSLPSDRTHEDAWLNEVILTSLGIFLTRDDAMKLATRLRSTRLFMEALTIDHHWADIEPRDLEEAFREFETLAIGHQGPRKHTMEPDIPYFDGFDMTEPVNLRKEAA